jgi:hypothetical protein
VSDISHEDDLANDSDIDDKENDFNSLPDEMYREEIEAKTIGTFPPDCPSKRPGEALGYMSLQERICMNSPAWTSWSYSMSLS